MPYADPEESKVYHRNYTRMWKVKNHEKALERNRKWYLKNKEKRADQVRWAAIKRLYGLSKKQWEAMNAEQNGCCAVCGHPPRGNGVHKNLSVDHCHDTGVVRGLLCQRCNPLVERMAAYLDKVAKRINNDR